MKKQFVKTKTRTYEVSVIRDMEQLAFALETERSIWARHRPYPTAFLVGWPYRLLKTWMKRGWLGYFNYVEANHGTN